MEWNIDIERALYLFIAAGLVLRDIPPCIQAGLSIYGLPPLKALEIHTERKQAFSRGNREHHLRRAFELEVPAGTTLRVCFWEQKPGGEKLHARFLLTEQGGLQYDYGLDEAGVGERTIVTLLQHSLWEQICRDYLCESQPDLPAQRRCHYRNTR